MTLPQIIYQHSKTWYSHVSEAPQASHEDLGITRDFVNGTFSCTTLLGASLLDFFPFPFLAQKCPCLAQDMLAGQGLCPGSDTSFVTCLRSVPRYQCFSYHVLDF